MLRALPGNPYLLGSAQKPAVSVTSLKAKWYDGSP